MTSGTFAIVELSFIQIHRDQRQRREIPSEHIAALAESIARNGLINPPVITREGDLIAGECRIHAMRHLGWTSTPVQWQDELDPKALRAIELEENIKRKDISWPDECRALAELHAMYAEESGWTQAKTADAIGLDIKNVEKRLMVARALAKGGDELLTSAPKLSTAINIVQRKNERARADETLSLREAVGAPQEEKIHVADFIPWAKSYSGPPFNLLHCDFPYGIDSDKFDQSSAKSFGGYRDTEEHYWNLVTALLANHEKLMAPESHLFFWFSMRYYQRTLQTLQSVFRVCEVPLIWNKTPTGILPDVNREPRRVYETAFFCSLGDRKIIRPVANLASFAPDRGDHMSAKSVEMLKHFFRMCVDERTRLLDPTCGSASALRAAEALGAKSVTGMEINPEFAERAKLSLLKRV